MEESSICICNPGYAGNGKICTDVNECTSNTHSCAIHAECENAIGSHSCTCRPGYTGNGKTCADIDECETNIYLCGANAICNNNMGSYNCSCSPGYFGNGQACLDVNECTTDAHSCNFNAYCNNTSGSYNCNCNPGFSGNGISCTDINECTTNVHNCDANAFCSNSEGSYNCTCSPGYTGNGTSCSACPAGWVENGNQCYFILPKEKNTFEGGYLCKQLGATLPIIKSAAENAFLLSLMERKGDPRLGMIAPNGDNVFEWLDGTAVADTFSAWNTGEPNNPGSENCAHLYVNGSGKGKWNNDPCTYSRAIVCQMEKK
ncbi:uncharacterized protein [Porites lutea]|uniref:uncharacterized protein isoform X2 n=1 Tax=Porites lutea TaxID=51062 RepID=UPI003CC6B771